MIEALRPSTLGEILDRAADIYRSRFLIFLGIAALPAGVVLASAVAAFLFFAWIGAEGRNLQPAMVAVLVLVFFGVGMLILAPLCAAAAAIGAGALNHAAVAAFYHRNITILEAYKAAWKHGWRYIGLFLLEALIIFVAPSIVWSIVIGIFGLLEGLRGASPEQAGTALGGTMALLILGASVYGVWMLLMLCLSFAISVAENASAGKALKRAIELSKGTRGRILVLYILGIVLRWGLGFLLTIPAILVITLVPGLDTPQHAQTIGTVFLLVIYGGSFAVRAFTKPVYTIAQLLFYYDQRIRKEGFDIEWMMLQAGMFAAPAATAEPAPPRIPPMTGGLSDQPMSTEPADASAQRGASAIELSPLAAANAVQPAPTAGDPA